MNIDISLIIPFYKSEAFIESCLKTVAAQIPSNCEVVLVNDGSPDRSAEIIGTQFHSLLASKQFSLINIGNSGPGAARNAGIKAARGRYVGFLDSDDILLPGYFDCVMPLIETGSIDLIQFHCVRFRDLDEVANAPIVKSHQSLGTFSLDLVRNEIFGAAAWFPCNRVYRKEILHRFPFVEGTFYEDVMTLPLMFLEDYVISLNSECLIGYRVNQSSTTSNHAEAHAKSLLDFLRRLDAMPSSVPLNILRIQLARSLHYFKIELGLKTFLLSDLLDIIKNIRATPEILDNLKPADRFFFQCPRLYTLINFLRVKRVR